MYRLKEMPPVRAMEYISSHPETFKAAHREERIDSLAVRAAIFRTINGQPHILMLHRAANDSLPGRWEMPGGGVEEDDPSMREAIAREIREETGLRTAFVVQEVGHGERWQKQKLGRTYHCLCITFVVETEEVEMLERGLLPQPSEEGGKSAANDDHLPAIPIKLSDAEHQGFAWVTEKELKVGQSGVHGPMEFTSEAMHRTMLEAFKVQEQITAAKQRSQHEG